MILCEDRKKRTDASVDVDKLPYPYTVESLHATFLGDVRVVARTKPWDFMEVGSFLFVSDKVKAILEGHNATVEFFPVTLAYKGKDLCSWFYLHLLKEVDCLDPEKTIFAGREPPLPEMVKHMVLRESACEGIPISRIGDTPDIGVSDELARAIRSAKCTGVIFRKPEEWRNPALHYG
jgi:hypothetical protein